MKLTVFILLTLFCLSCKKETTMHIAAKNRVTGQVYPNLKFYVVEYKSAIYEGKYTTIAEGNLNDNGEVFITKKLKKNRAYIIRVETPPNVCYQSPQEISYTYTLSDGVNPNFEFQFAECAYSKLIIKNINCQSTNDKFELFRQDQLGSLSGTGWVQYGCVNWETNGYSDVPMGMRFYKWEVTKNGILETFYDTLYINAGEYKIYEINY